MWNKFYIFIWPPVLHRKCYPYIHIQYKILAWDSPILIQCLHCLNMSRDWRMRSFFSYMDRSGPKMNLYCFYIIFLWLPRFYTTIFSSWSISYQNILEIPGISIKIYTYILASCFGDFLIPYWRTANKLLFILRDESTINQYYWRQFYKS